MKRIQKAKELVRIRQKTLANGNDSIYLDIYKNGKRNYEFLKLYLIPERNSSDKAKNKETLQSIIDNKNLSDAEKENAVNQMVQMTEIAEKEAAAESLLAAKGFNDSVVSITDDQADVIVGASELSDANRAQIEDIVTRKTGVAAQNIVINPVNADSK